LISLETAKLAKEKGFDISCIYFYHNKSDNAVIEKGGGKIKIFKDWNSNDNGMYVTCWSAPTQSLLQKWLRKEHEIHSWVEHKGTYYFPRVNKFNKGNNVGKPYEEALEEALYEGLKLI
jgi:hypothetical protein